MNEPTAMTLTAYLIFGLLGAALLGFFAAWFWRRHELETIKGQLLELNNDAAEKKAVLERHNSENETQRLAIENLQRLLQNIENQSFEQEQQLKKLESDNENLREEKLRLIAEVGLLMNEFEALRDLPKIDLETESEDENGEMDQRIKAKKLVRAFKKGLSNSNTPSPPPSHS